MQFHFTFIFLLLSLIFSIELTAQVIIKEKVEINPLIHSDGGKILQDTSITHKINFSNLAGNGTLSPDNAQSTILMPFYGRVNVEVILSDAALSSRVSLEIRQPEYQMLSEYANHNVGFTWSSDNFTEGTPVEFGIDWYWNQWGTIYQGKEAGVVTTQISPTEYTMGFEALGDDWDYNELVIRVKFIPTEIVVTIDPPVIFPGDTASIIIKNRLSDGTLIDFPPMQKFEAAMLDGCIYGQLKAGVDSGTYLNNVLQPIYFIADTGALDSGAALLRVGLVEETPLHKTSVQAEIQSNYCSSSNFISQNFDDAKLTVDNPLVILCPTPSTTDSITSEPQMPTVICKAMLKNYDKGEVTFEWEYWISYTLLRHKFKSIDTLMRRTGKIQICGKSYSNNSEITYWTVPFDKDSLKYVLLTVKQPEIPGWSKYGGDNNEKRTNWEEGEEIFFGGDVFLQITAKNSNGNMIGFKQQNSGRIFGKNPLLQDVLNYITSKEFKAIVKHESKSKQFNITYIDQYNKKGYPRYGAPNGYGLAQIDNPPPLEMDLWNWKSNLNRGKSIYDSVRAAVYNFMEKHPNTYTEEMLLKCAFQKYNMGGYDNSTRITHYFWKWDDKKGIWVDDEYIIERTKALGFKERYGINVWNIYNGI